MEATDLRVTLRGLTLRGRVRFAAAGGELRITNCTFAPPPAATATTTTATAGAHAALHVAAGVASLEGVRFVALAEGALTYWAETVLPVPRLGLFVSGLFRVVCLGFGLLPRDPQDAVESGKISFLFYFFKSSVGLSVRKLHPDPEASSDAKQKNGPGHFSGAT